MQDKGRKCMTEKQLMVRKKRRVGWGGGSLKLQPAQTLVKQLWGEDEIPFTSNYPYYGLKDPHPAENVHTHPALSIIHWIYLSTLKHTRVKWNKKHRWMQLLGEGGSGFLGFWNSFYANSIVVWLMDPPFHCFIQRFKVVVYSGSAYCFGALTCNKVQSWYGNDFMFDLVSFISLTH